MSNDHGPDFDGVYRRAWKSNYAGFTMGEAAEKIATFAEKTGIGESVIKEKIRDDSIFKWVFVKDPKRQNIYEGEAASWLRRQPGISDFEHLGPNDLMLCAGLVMTKHELHERGGATTSKSLDFKWSTRGHTVFATHKYTLEGGGAQDNQYNDLHAFIDEANQSRAPRTIFIAIADGPYYNTRDALRKATHMEALRQAANGKTVFAGRSIDVPEILQANIP